MSDNQKLTNSVKVGLVSLGCAKNLVDSEIMLGSLLKEGVEITNDAESADAIIVNTCSFIDSSREESVDAILEADAVRDASNRNQALIVAGCLTQRYGEELARLIPEVDRFMGIDQVNDIARIVREAIAQRADRLTHPIPVRNSRARSAQVVQNLPTQTAPVPSESNPLIQYRKRPVYVPDYETPRFRLTPSHFAYLKIAEGCNHPCSFCTIPRMRGSHRSRPQSDIVAEARSLIADGVREINLISQDSTYYGLDLRPDRKGSIASPANFSAATASLPVGSTTLSSLLRELNDIEGEFWIRLLYTHPAHWTDDLIDTIASCQKVARYIDMPLQHIHPAMLERMRRETSKEYIVNLIQKIRSAIPNITIRTTFIVGFPGETEEFFQELMDFVRVTRFERLGVFTYSNEEGTPASKMANQIHPNTKKRRARQIMQLQQDISSRIGKSLIGSIIRVLPEKLATTQELSLANIQSWEHGHLRQNSHNQDVLLPQDQGLVMVCRSQSDAPDIDGRIYVPDTGIAEGEFINVRISGCTDYDFFAELVHTS